MYELIDNISARHIYLATELRNNNDIVGGIETLSVVRVEKPWQSVILGVSGAPKYPGIFC